MKDHLFNMLGHMTWADRRLLEAFQSSEGEPSEALTLYSHIIATEKVWLARLEGQDSSGLSIWPAWDVEGCAAAAGTIAAGFDRLLNRLTPADLSQEISYRNSKGIEYRNAASDILIHVFMHGSYHRGQINSRLRGAGFEPVAVDYIAFVRE